MAKRLQYWMIGPSSVDSPEWDSISTTSSGVTMPRSPWPASAGCRKMAGVPVEVKVAVILRATMPLLPMPVTITRPRTFMMTPISRTNVAAKSRSENCASSALRPNAATDRLWQAAFTIRPPEPNGTIFEASVDTRLPFFPHVTAGYPAGTRGDEPPYLVRRLSLVPRPLAGLTPGTGRLSTPFQGLMANHFATAKRDFGVVLLHTVATPRDRRS